MYFLLTLFVASLFGISLMIGRKLLMIQNGELPLAPESIPENSYFIEEWKYSAVKGLKRYSYATLVAVIRFYVILSSFLKNKIQELQKKIQSNRGAISNTKEPNKFLRMVSEYKKKVRRIKERVKEEENL